MIAPAISIRPLPGLYYVELLKPDNVLPSGLILPESSVENFTDAMVLAAGPARVWPSSGLRQLMWAGVGHRVLFPAHCREEWVLGESRTGFVRDEDLMAVLMEPFERVEPVNGWVLVRPLPIEEAPGGIFLPDAARTASRRGVVLDFSFGEVIRKGPRAGLRGPIYFDEHGNRELWLKGKTVHWDEKASFYVLPDDSGRVSNYLIRATDLIAIEELDDA